MFSIDNSTFAATGDNLTVGDPADKTTGVFLTNGSTFEATRNNLALQANLSLAKGTKYLGVSDGTGTNAITGSVSNAGGISLAGTGAGDILTISGDYSSDNGVIGIDTELGDDNSATDRVDITGNTSGSGILAVNNVGGAGAQTDEGIEVITVGGSSDGQFTLAGNYDYNGQPAVVAGAYAYQLYKGDKSGDNTKNWYLRSELKPVEPTPDPDPTLDPDTNPEQHLYQAGVPVYEAYPQALLGMNGVSTLQQRIGNRVWMGSGNHVVAQGADTVASPYAAAEDAGTAINGNGVWGRIEGAHNRIEPRFSTSGTDYYQNVFKIQAGLDGILAENEAGMLIGGITVHYAHGKTTVSSPSGDGDISTDGYGFGGTLTWYGDNGFYLDGQAQATWYRSDLNSVTAKAGLGDGNHGFGYALSLEGGKRIAFDEAWSLTPQAQLVYSSVDFDDFTDPFGADVSLDRGDSLQGRLGLTLDHETSWQNANGMLDRLHVYGIANLYYEFLEGTKIDVAGVSFASEKDRLWGGLGLGGAYNWNDDKYSIYGEGMVNTSLNNFGDSYTVKGNVGFRVKW